MNTECTILLIYVFLVVVQFIYANYVISDTEDITLTDLINTFIASMLFIPISMILMSTLDSIVVIKKKH